VGRFFANLFPAPIRFQVPYGLDYGYFQGRRTFNAHAITRLWFRPTPGNAHVFAEFGIFEDAYTRVGGRTDGVEFVVSEINQDGAERILFKRYLDPVHRERDRGLQHLDITALIETKSELVFETRPGPAGDFGYDWAYWGTIRTR
jgi:hypothetical protein